MTGFEVSRTTTTPASAIWALLDDSTTWPDWTTIDRARIDEPAAPGATGEVRSFTTGRITVVERIVERDAPHRLVYELLRGLPVRDYRAVITLEERDGGTVVRWATTFRPALPLTGPVFRFALHKATRRFVDGLLAAAG